MNISKIFISALCLFLAGCYADYPAEEQKQADLFGNTPQCRQETNVAIYDKQGTYVVPGCLDYATTNASLYDFDEEKDFPYVENNKHPQNEIVMENLNTRVLAYCRGSQDEIDACVSRLEESCYVKVSDIPYMSAKYDTLKRGTYPTRRWRNGENVPRW